MSETTEVSCVHEWEQSREVLDSLPEIYARYCVKCPAAQTKRGIKGEWRDNTAPMNMRGPRAYRKPL